MSLLIHRAERADHLVHALGVLLSNPLPDPFATEIVSVPTPGVERWLSQRLAARLGTRPGRSDGVCAAVDFCSPGRLVARVLAVTGATADEEDPWRPDRMVWPLLRVIDPEARTSLASAGELESVVVTGGNVRPAVQINVAAPPVRQTARVSAVFQLSR